MDTRQRLEQLCAQAADRIEALTAQLAEDADARTQIDHRLEELVGQVDALTAERDDYKRLAGLADTLARECRIHESRAEAAEADNARLRGLIDDVVCGRGMFGLSADDDLKWAMQHLGSALNTGKEVMPDEARTTRAAHDIGPGDQAVAGAALEAADSWLTRWAAHVGPCIGGAACTCGLSRVRFDVASALETRAALAAQPEPVAGAAPTVDELAQIIRTVDGNHTLGAGELAERILSALAQKGDSHE
jgi:hypothetical protein